MDVAKLVEQKIAEEIDISKYSKEIDKAINDYFKTDSFKDSIAECLYDEGIGWDIGKIVAPQIIKALKGNIKVTI